MQNTKIQHEIDNWPDYKSVYVFYMANRLFLFEKQPLY